MLFVPVTREEMGRRQNVESEIGITFIHITGTAGQISVVFLPLKFVFSHLPVYLKNKAYCGQQTSPLLYNTVSFCRFV